MSTILVDDFGCVPDGRFLERIAIAAGAAVLTDSDGIFRPTDVGKNIAIPGAIDLIATIARLVDHRQVRNAAMDAAGGEPRRLTGTLFDPEKPAGQDEEPFLASVHVGRRITVAGAGPGGSTLVTDIAAVINATTIELAGAAATTVSNIEVILNRPDRVALSDYARRTVSNLTLDLGDRAINDGAMTIGGRGLESETARFSSLDLGKEVTILEAGLFVTTIHSFASNTQVTLAAPAQRAVAEGLADVWQTDSRPGLELLLAALASRHVAAAEIRFGPGVYDFTRIPDPAHPMNAAIGLQDLKNLTIRGSGPGVTILRLMPQQDLSGPDTHVIETRDCQNLTFRDLSVHGAYLTMSKTNEQMHGINLNEGSEEIVVQRVRVFQSAGDGLRFLGRPANKVRQVWVDGCRFIQNKRTGVAFQRAAEFVWLRNCYIEMTPPSTDSCIDFEPSGNAAPSDIIIDSNIMLHGTRATAVSISGISGPDPTRRVNFSNNIIIGGDIFCTDVAQLTIQNNLVLVTNLGSRNRIPLHVQRGGDSILISDNLLVNDDTATTAVIALSEVNQRQVTRALVANNLCFARSGLGIQCLSSDDVAIQGNMIVATGAGTLGIFLRSQSSDMANISLRDNDITVQGSGTWHTGIHIAATDPHQIHHISVMGNSVHGASEGIRFQGPGFQQTPLCALNRIDAGVTSPLLGISSLPQDSLIVGGGVSRGGTAANSGAGRLIAGLGNPNDKVTGNIGDIFQRLDIPPPGEEDASNLYVKTSGNDTNTGWTAK
jgi:hypothetical protein